jgi:archaellum component FlaC
MSPWKKRIEDHIYDLKKLWKVRDEQAEGFSGRIKALTGRVERLEMELKKSREATGYRLDELTETVQAQVTEINDVVAEHVGTEHEGLNHGLYRDLVSRGIDPWEVVAIIRNNRGKS